jgi:hypothetical protein
MARFSLRAILRGFITLGLCSGLSPFAYGFVTRDLANVGSVQELRRAIDEGSKYIVIWKHLQLEAQDWPSGVDGAAVTIQPTTRSLSVRAPRAIAS